MHRAELILVTGSTGFLGARLVTELLELHPEASLALLVRGRPEQSALDRVAAFVPARHLPRVQVFSGDVTLPDCGLSQEDYRRLAASVTRVIHSAATVRFDHTLEEASQINVEGTRRILDFAAHAPDLQSFTYIGTAYVAGDRTGLVREDELDVGQGFRNTYERTKCQAEALVRSRQSSLPIVIVRPSIIVGDSRTGVTTSFKMMYWPLKIYARRLWRTVPGSPGAILDIVPVDYVAAATARLAFDPAALGAAVHLCAGSRSSATLHQIATRASEYFRVPAPRYVNPALFFGALRPLLLLTLWGRRRRILHDGRAYRSYFSMRMQFDVSIAERLLAPHGLQPPPVMDYLDRLLRYCTDSDWGRKQTAAL